MNDIYFRTHGFDKLTDEQTQGVGFFTSARYRHTHAAQDGTLLYAEHPLGIPRFRLSTLAAPLDQSNVLADLALTDEAGLDAATAAFFAQHGGVGKVVQEMASQFFRPYRCKY